MSFSKWAVTGILVLFFTSCYTYSPAPGEYDTIKGAMYNRVDLPLDIAWQKSIETLSSRWKVISNDTVNGRLVVETFYHDVQIDFKSLTNNTSEFTVSSTELFVKPNKAAVHTVYMELYRALQSLED